MPIPESTWRSAAYTVSQQLGRLYSQQSQYAVQLTLDDGRRTLAGALAAGTALLLFAALLLVVVRRLVARVPVPVVPIMVPMAHAAIPRPRHARSRRPRTPEPWPLKAVLDDLRRRFRPMTERHGLRRKEHAVGPHATPSRSGRLGRVSPHSDLRPYLRTLDAETLADLLHAHAERDPELRHSLELRAATQSGDVSEAHRLLDTAVTDGNVEYTAKIGAVLDTLQRMLDLGSRADLAPLARRTVDDISEVLEQSGDHTGDLGDRLDRAVELYARACAARPPDPEKLADWILEVEFDGPGWPVDRPRRVRDGAGRARPAPDQVHCGRRAHGDRGRAPP